MKKTIKDFRDMAEGYGNLYKAKTGANGISAEAEKLAAERMAICNTCPVRTGLLCNPFKHGPHAVTGEKTFGCGCPLPAKTRSKDSKCPLGKW